VVFPVLPFTIVFPPQLAGQLVKIFVIPISILFSLPAIFNLEELSPISFTIACVVSVLFL
jgi:hypothetical protein